MLPWVQHPAEYIQRFMAEASVSETFFCFESPVEGEAHCDTAVMQEYSVRFFIQDGCWQLSLVEGKLAEPEKLRDAESISVQGPWLLSTVNIPKPWGEEIWFSAYEKRGVCCFSSKPGQRGIPIPVMLHLFPQLLANAPALNLLKILAPYSSELLGELYFEMHQEKQEVYVVSHIDPIAWPTGVAKMRFGFAKDKLAEYADFSAFKIAYMKAVTEYQSVRQQIDELITLSVPCNEEYPESEAYKKNQLSTLDPQLQKLELDLSKHMSSFIGHREVRLGDVITVPKLLPHGLLHGVRVVEFQTPVYERLILSFRQRVLTQSHWDTQRALDLLDNAPQTGETITIESEGSHLHCGESVERNIALNTDVSHLLCAERIVAFDDFEVFRVQYLADGGVSIAALIEALTPNVGEKGNILLLALHSLAVKSAFDEQFLQAEQGMCIPLLKTADTQALSVQAKKGAVLLISRSVC